jgi:hypothetical protein
MSSHFAGIFNPEALAQIHKDSPLVTPIAKRLKPHDACSTPRKAPKNFEHQTWRSPCASPSTIIALFHEFGNEGFDELDATLLDPNFEEPATTLEIHEAVTPHTHNISHLQTPLSPLPPKLFFSSTTSFSQKRKKRNVRPQRPISPMAKLAKGLCDKPSTVAEFLRSVVQILSDSLTESNKQWVLSLGERLISINDDGTYNGEKFYCFKTSLEAEGRVRLFDRLMLHQENIDNNIGRVIFLAAFMIALEESQLIEKFYSFEEICEKPKCDILLQISLNCDEKLALANYFSYITALKYWFPITSAATIIKQTAELLNFSENRATFGGGETAYARAVKVVYDYVFAKPAL